MDLLKSKVTWAIVLNFIVAGCVGVGWISAQTGGSIISLLTVYGLSIHNEQIKAGKLGKGII